MTRRLAALAVALVGSVALPTVADARVERFVAQLKLDQRTTWSEPLYDGPVTGSCDSRYYERRGIETTRFRTIPIRVRVMRLPGQTIGTFAYGSARKPVRALRGKGQVSRTYVSKASVTDGPCRPTPGVVHGEEDDVDTSCDGTFESEVLLNLRVGSVLPSIRHTNLLTLGDAVLHCDAEYPHEIDRYVTALAGRLSWSEVFGDEEYVIVRARETVEGPISNGGTSKADVRMTLRMRRAGPAG